MSSVAGLKVCTLPRGAPITATTAAFAAAIRTELAHVSISLLRVEGAAETPLDAIPNPWEAQSNRASFALLNRGFEHTQQQQQQQQQPMGQRRHTLLGTQAAVQGSQRRLAFLAEVLERVVLDEPMEEAVASSWLLDHLAAMLTQRSSLADPQGVPAVSAVLRYWLMRLFASNHGIVSRSGTMGRKSGLWKW